MARFVPRGMHLSFIVIIAKVNVFEQNLHVIYELLIVS